MLSYFLRRMLLIIPTFLGITLLVFSITRFVPGGPVERMLLQAQVSQNETGRSSGSKGAQALSDEQIEELKAFYGLDKPMLVAYWEWLQKLAVLDLGESTRYYEPVWDLIKDKLPVTAFFGLARRCQFSVQCFEFVLVHLLTHEGILLKKLLIRGRLHNWIYRLGKPFPKQLMPLS
nr:hypothetical protein [Aeromonas salmonicida]